MHRASSKNSLFSITSDAPCSEVYNIGDRCKMGGGSERVGTVAFVGRTQFAPGDWVGLVLEVPEGKNNGSVNGVAYFECEDKYGLFCRPSKLVRLSPSPMPAPASPSLSIANSTATNCHRLSPYAREYGYDLGERVLIPGGKMGVVKFLDKIDNEVYVGVLLDRPLGSCDGTMNGRRHFKCNPLYGTFVTADKAKKVANEKPSKMAVRHNKASTLRSQGGQGGGGSSAGWRGSQESLSSMGVASTCSSRAYRASPKVLSSKLTTTPTNIPHTITEGLDDSAIVSLKTCLQEKEAHLERLSRELSDQQRSEAERVSQLSSAKSELQRRIADLEGQLNESEKSKACLQSELDQRRQRIDELSFLFEEAEVLRLDAENTAKRVQEQQQNKELVQLASVEEAESVEVSCQTEAEKAPRLVDIATQSEQTQNSSTSTETNKPAISELACQTDTTDTTPELIHQQTQSDALEKTLVKTVDTQTTPGPSLVELGVQAELGKDSAEIFTQTAIVHLTDLAQQTDKLQITLAETQTDAEPIAPKAIMVEFTCQTMEPAKGVDKATQDALFAPRIDASASTEVVATLERDSETDAQKEAAVKSLSHAGAQTEPIVPNVREMETQSDIRSPWRHGETQTDAQKEAAVKSVSHTGAQTELIVPNVREMETQSDIRSPWRHGETQTIPPPTTAEKGVDPVVEQKASHTTHDGDSQTLPPPESISKEVQAAIATVQNLAESATQTHSQLFPTTSCASVQTTYRGSENIAITQTDLTAHVTSDKAVQAMEKTDSTATSTQTSPVSSSSKTPPRPKDGNGKETVVELDASKLNVASMPSALALEERYRSQSEQVEKLDCTVSFLNSIISEQTGTINKLRAELNESRMIDEHEMVAESIAGKRNAEAQRQRDYCDLCEVFDQHDTAACPRRETEETERLSHNTSFSPSSATQRGGVARQKGGGGAYESRLFCDICDAFDLHDTRQCPKLSPATNTAVGGNSINRTS